MQPRFSSQNGDAWIPLLTFVVSVVALLPAIWSETSVTGMDEYRLSLRTPMEMLDRGDWLTPWCNGQPRLAKPPLLYWATLAAYRTLGVHLVAARLWGVLAGAGLSLGACLLARELFRSNGLLAGLITVGSVGVAVEGRQAMLDLPVALFAALAVWLFLKWLRTECLPWLLLSGLSLGLSFLSKGPVGLFFFLAGALTACWRLRLWAVMLKRGWQLGLWLAVVALVTLPWPLTMQHLWGERFYTILGEEVTSRRFGQWHGMAPLSALTGALGLIFPWTLVSLGAITDHFRQPAARRSREVSWLIAWFLASVLPFFFMKSFERYMLAVVPAQAVLAAEWLQSGPSRLKTALMRVSLAMLAALALALCGFVWWFRLGLVMPLAGLLATVWMLVCAVKPTPAWKRVAVATLLFTVVLGGVYPRLGIGYLPADIQDQLTRLPARTFKSPQPAMLSMRLRYSVQEFDANRLTASSRPDGGAEVVFVEETWLPEFQEVVRAHALQAEPLGTFKTLYSRKAWIRFARRDATWADWQAALRTRSLEPLKTEIRYYRVSSRKPA